MAQGCDDRLALRRSRCDRRAPDAEPAPGEVDVMEPVGVDEPAAGDVPDLGVVLPAIPQPSHYLDVVGGLIEQIRQEMRCRRLRAVGQAEGRELTPAEGR